MSVMTIGWPLLMTSTGHQRGIQRGDVVAVAHFGGKRAAVFEPDGVLVGVEHADSRGGGVTGAVMGIEQRVHDSGDRVGGLQRGVELREDQPRLGVAIADRSRSRAAADSRAATRSIKSWELNGFGR